MINRQRNIALCTVMLLMTLPAGFLSHVQASAIESELQDLAAEAIRASERPKHYAAIYNIGEYALALRVHLIRSARHSIDIQTFIWTDDATTRFLFSELKRAAQRGVSVRLLIDHASPFGNRIEPLAAMVSAHANIKIRYFKPISKNAIKGPVDYTSIVLSNFQKLNRRMHNKLFVVDDRIAILGGRNYQTIYYDWDEEFNFKDREIVTCGPVSGDMKESFETYWAHEHSIPAIQFIDIQAILAKWSFSRPDDSTTFYYDASEFTALSKLANNYSLASQVPDGHIFETGKIEFVCDPPVLASRSEIEEDSSHLKALETELRNAKSYIVGQSPYLVACKWTKGIVRDIVEDNPDFEIHFSTNSVAATNHVIVGAVALKQQRKQLTKLKYHIYQFKPYPEDAEAFFPRIQVLEASNKQTELNNSRNPRSSLHAKSLVIDGKIAVVSTSNFDPRSTYLNTECAVIVHDKAFATALEENIRRDMAPRNSWVVAERKSTPVIGQFNNLMASISGTLPVLDVWPTPHTSCFELKEGKAPLPRSHPEFYQHYRGVGNFPGCEEATVGIKVRFFKALFGWATPMM